MFGSLAEKFGTICSSLMGRGKLTESNLSDAVREVRLALLDADVHFQVAKKFIQRVKEKALGDAVLKSVTPGQQFVKILHEELVELLGGGETELQLAAPLAIWMLCGLQGGGKTTQAAKLAHFLKGKSYRKRPLLVACDLQRPAAVEQLRTLAAQIEVPFFALEGAKDPLEVAREALQLAKREGYSALIVDTAGRQHVDGALMEELQRLKGLLEPHEVLFVANAATGQDAVQTALAFEEKVGITGSILTMLDGDARGGAALSIREVTGKPLKFEGVGERVEDLQLFHAHSLADRILGMGDTINLVKRMQEQVSEEEAKRMEEKVRKATFTYEDSLEQMRALRKMGSLGGLMKMFPGFSQVNMEEMPSQDAMKHMEAIVYSMTARERRGEDLLSVSRRKRIARGSGRPLTEVDRLVKSFEKTKEFCKGVSMKGLSSKMEKMLGGNKWR